MRIELGDVQIRLISADQTIPLRHSVLWPNYPVSHVRIPDDDSGFHYGAFIPSQERPVAVISVFKEPLPLAQAETAAARFRKFACDPAFQGRGIGTRLLEYVFEVAYTDLGCSVVWCDARASTLDWYKRRGMMPFGETFFKEDVAYIRMRRTTPQ
ncbi:hypothetical protein AcV7_004977 [Taiwanofungus camphoratus]|nr:hypothetical protein AcV7_004977 [Antrodia cinnamomea]